MSTPPGKDDAAGFAVLLVVLATAVPAAVVVLPDTASYVMPQAVRDLGLPDAQAAGLVRACGLALPALILTAPLTAALVRRAPAWLVLFAGLAVLLAAQGLSVRATSVPAVGAVRVAEGAAGGIVLPATLALARERGRHRAAPSVWAGVLVAALLLATPLALAATAGWDPDGVEWRAILCPYWWLSAIALVGVATLGLLRARPARRAGPPTGALPAGLPAAGVAPAAARTERLQLLLPVVPVGGFAFLAVVTTYDWSPGAQLLLAACGIAGLLGLAVVGSRDATTGSPLGYAVVMPATGLLTMPVTGPLAGLVGDRAVPLTAFVAGGAGAVAAALLAGSLGRGTGRRVMLCGYGLDVVAILLLLTTGAAASLWTLLTALCALGAGTGLAVGAALRHADAGPALFGLSLCFPAVLGGHLVVGPLQIAKVGAVTGAGGDPAAALYALTAAYRLWLVAAGGIAVLLAAVTAWASRNRTRASPAGPADSGGTALPGG
ncbi:hypothetical protein NE235_31875 [Actinoallomurus spadix]|uniref:MFS transporter n=1 Tax=Actinoallomurus spadix TaxID=79912 RepID=A0ABN0VQW8_9ACTN|nr:hypothetical protein [Actinoallomurus spadix]MCO5990720.1 hypothetical protein [Actinoallomurus spadix]